MIYGCEIGRDYARCSLFDDHVRHAFGKEAFEAIHKQIVRGSNPY